MFGIISIGRYYDGVFVVGDVLLNVVLDERFFVKVVDGNIEVILILRVVEVYGNDVVCISVGKEVSN